ncbi:hypothetical protein [Peribacillus frigoritolerans]|uniref:hypothetical protein n=1 Tax=Peribacillus frigoritolerans TaxID=450367 RepID=UPI00399F4DBC
MISRLDEKTRRIIGICMVVAMPVIIVSALIYGIYLDAEDQKAAKTDQASKVDEKMHDYGQDQENAEPEVKEGSPETDSSSEGKETTVFIPSQADMQNAQTVAMDFIKAFHSFDHQNPGAYLEKAKPYMTDEMYSFYEKNPKKGTLDGQKVEVKNTSATPGDFQEETQIWNIEVTSEQTDTEGKKQKVITPYSVLLKANGDTWNVDGVKIDE